MSMVIEKRPPAAAKQKLRVLLAIFDFPVLSAGFRSAIEAETDMEVVGQADERDVLQDRINQTGADVVITECPPLNACGRLGIETIDQIRDVRPDMRILVIECGSSSDQFSMVLKAGADGFLTRDAHAVDVVAALRSISHGQTYVSPAIVTKMVSTYLLRTPHGNFEDPYDSLNEREREVLVLAATGHTNREIARIFHLSEQTVHNYRACLMEKLGFHDRVELLRFAIRRGLISVADL
jgi:two-component system response regulator NreC